MLKTARLFIGFLFCLGLFETCSNAPEKAGLHYEALDAGELNDSLSIHLANYKDDFGQWKTVYEHCMNDTLFHNAIYLGLQDKIGISSICNQTELNLNKQIMVLDTSANGNIFDLLSVNNSANCFSKINLNKNLQDVFYRELIRNLKNAGDYKFLSDLVDTNQIVFKISTMIDYSLRPDSLISLLQRTKDSSLIYYRQILITSGNGLLARVAMIFGFEVQFHLKRKLSSEEAGKLKNQFFFRLGDHGERGNIQLLPEQNIKAIINKNYIVLGEFYVFSEARSEVQGN
ncbi:MAG TPA: hypothetical protein VGZ90_18025 [Puia sp.]|jgi:hypothetical protein|nr:hypothetical protein [Puia sp.]